MMQEAIKNFNQQFDYQPKIINAQKLKRHNKFLILGMGGSHLGADLLLNWKPELDILVHNDYALPALSKDELKKRLIIASSYSGNTEEVIDGLNQSLKERLALAVVSVNGRLIEIAKKKKLPYIQLPDIGLQPRMALGFNIKSLLTLINNRQGLREVNKLAKDLKPLAYKNRGRKLAKELKGKVPLIYSSFRNQAIAYNWKIKFNETSKIPAFYNIFPELNHNEMTGFDIKSSTKKLSKNFKFIFLEDNDDDPRIIKRMRVLRSLLCLKGLAVEVVKIKGKGRFHKIFSSLTLADWAAFYIAKEYGLEPEQVPMVEEFKRLVG